MNRSAPVLCIVFTATFMGTARGADPYLNQKIVPKYGRLVAFVGSTAVANEMDFDWPLEVKRVDGQWLWITDDGHFHVVCRPSGGWHGWTGEPIQGWVRKDQVLLLEGDPIENKKSAIDYLSDRLREDHNTGWAYWLRGLIFENNGDWAAAIADEKTAVTIARVGENMDRRLNSIPIFDWSTALATPLAGDLLSYFAASLEAYLIREAECDSNRKAVQKAPWLDVAFATLASCEYHQALLEHAVAFEKLRRHEKKLLTLKEVPQICDAIWHFTQAACLRPRPRTFSNWADSLAVRDLNRFQRRIWIFYLEDPDSYFRKHEKSIVVNTEYLTRRKACDAIATSALGLYDRAILICRSYADAHYGRGGVFEYLADYQVYMMTEGSKWKKLTMAKEVSDLKKQLRSKEAKISKLKAELESLVEEMDRLADLRTTEFHRWRIQSVTDRRREHEKQIDKGEAEIETLKKKYDTAISKNQIKIDEMQRATLERINDLARLAINDYNEAIAVNQNDVPSLRDRAAVSLMLLDPTGLRPITAFKTPLDFGRAELANNAMTWAKTAAELFDYGDTDGAVLATLATALNATGSFEEAGRREKSAWNYMDKDEREFAVNFIELYKENESKAPKVPK